MHMDTFPNLGDRQSDTSKPWEVDYAQAKAYHPISLLSFLSEAMEKSVDSHTRDNVCTETNLPKF
jgi:hypothetical protein